VQHRLISLVSWALSCLAFSSGALAHHSSAPHFDRDSEIVVEGVVTELKFVNPHAYLYFDVEQDGELINWRCELSAATQLRRFGWSADMFSAGQQITVKGAPARREDNVCFLNSLTLDDGTVITRRGNLTKATQVRTNPESTPKPERPTYLPNGQPNLQGPWISRSFGRNSERIRANFTATEAGKKAAEGYEMEFDDPILRCHVVNIFNGWNHDQHVNDIIQSDETVTLQYGFMDFARTIHLGQEQHPDDIEPSTGGHSIAHWDGGTLVVDTIGFEEGVLNHQSGLKHSDQMHVVERFHFDVERNYLVRDYTVTDPRYLVGEASGQDLMALSESPYTPYNCVELSGDNNIRPSEQ
jgi:hypothetical protein